MFLAWRTQLREAQQACEVGRLDEAAQRLSEHQLRQYKPGEEFAHQLASAYLGRVMRRADEGNFAGAWHDLTQARQLAGANEAWQAAHVRLIGGAIVSVEPHLMAGDFALALRRLKALEGDCVPHDVVRASQDAVRRAESAANLIRRGKLLEAEELLAAAVALRPEWRSLADRLVELRTQQAELRQQNEALHNALQNADWNGVVAIADRLLTISPEYRLAREARQKAWAQVGAKVPESQHLAQTIHWPGAPSHDEVATRAPQTAAGTRFLLWIDAVGGYLVCLAEEIWIGQAAPGNNIAVPIQAELSRRHAKLRRSGDGYVLEAEHPVTVHGAPLVGKHLLTDGDEFELGRGVKLRFRQPHPLSLTARLEIVSRHRTQPGCDGILLMAESCVLGPKWQSHVVCRDWANDVVLYRQENELFCRSVEQIAIDGVVIEGRGKLAPNSRVEGESLSFSLELMK